MKDYTPKQLNDLGDVYFYGKSQEKNIELAFTYYKKAADLNNPIGYYNVAKYFIEKKQFKQANEYLIKAKELGYTVASIKLSKMYLEGLGFRKNKKKAFKFMAEAVEKNDKNALHQLGYLYEEGLGIRKDEAKAKKYYELSSDSNNPNGMYYLGKLLIEGKNIKRDYENGYFWLDKAADLGNVSAIKKLIDLYKNNHQYLRKKSKHYLEEMEFHYLELLAKEDDIEALKTVSDTYYHGNSIIKVNNEKALTYYKVLFDFDETKGYTGLGKMYLYGKACDEDYKKAKEYLDIAGTRHDYNALNALGEIYRLGYGVDINYLRAKDYYFEAAKGEDPDALINMGLLNYRKQIPNAKEEIAFNYIERAKAKGNNNAYYWLGIFYEKGIGVPKEFKKAEINYLKAIELGNLGAKYKYSQLLFDYVKNNKQSSKKKNVMYIKIRDLLFEYIESNLTSEINTVYAMYMLGELYSFDNFDLKSKKISRYYYELASEKKFTKAMVKMYLILKDKEPKVAIEYLENASKRPADGASLYYLGLLYLDGNEYINKDEVKGKELLGKASGLNYNLAKEKLTMI